MFLALAEQLTSLVFAVGASYSTGTEVPNQGDRTSDTSDPSSLLLSILGQTFPSPLSQRLSTTISTNKTPNPNPPPPNLSQP